MSDPAEPNPDWLRGVTAGAVRELNGILRSIEVHLDAAPRFEDTRSLESLRQTVADRILEVQSADSSS